MAMRPKRRAGEAGNSTTPIVLLRIDARVAGGMPKPKARA